MDTIKRYGKMILDKIIEHFNPTMVFFIVMFFAFEIGNGMYGEHFDLGALITFAGVILAKDAAQYGISSALNSPRGEAPMRK